MSTSNLSLRDLTPPRPPRITPSSATPVIELTVEEERLCTLLHDCTKQFRDRELDHPPLECRIAGGWVRDKLLGKDSNDIDIALSSMMGIAFAEIFVPFLEQRGFEVHNVVKIERNPEQSKHLETAKATLMDMEIDFVNLRSEQYAKDSRIPTKIDFGTPLQDALRRDITINALFYNVHTRSVEDYTGKGLDDLRQGIVRTPLPPKETFLDDPLRVLRCIRFASRFGLELDPPLMESVRDKEVQDALVGKISRDRVGEEIDKMLKGRDPLHALQLADEMSVYDQIFYLPPNLKVSDAVKPRKSAVVAASLLTDFLGDNTRWALPSLHDRLLEHSKADHGTRRRLYLAAALMPYRGLTYLEKKKSHPVSEVVIREGLKIGNQNKYLSGVPLILEAHNVISRPSLDKFSEPAPRAAIGLALRDKTISNEVTEAYWSSSILFCLIQDLVDLWDFETDTLDLKAATQTVNLYNTFVAKVVELNLETDAIAPPILDGKEVCEVVGSRPGAWMAGALGKVVEWQLAHPEGTKEECKEFIKSEAAAGRLVVQDVKRPAGEVEGKKKKIKS